MLIHTSYQRLVEGAYNGCIEEEKTVSGADGEEAGKCGSSEEEEMWKEERQKQMQTKRWAENRGGVLSLKGCKIITIRI